MKRRSHFTQHRQVLPELRLLRHKVLIGVQLEPALVPHAELTVGYGGGDRGRRGGRRPTLLAEHDIFELREDLGELGAVVRV